MLKAHMEAKENALVAISKVPANSGHSLHKGTPREAFVREFLESHLPASAAVGTGEIIDSNSRPNERRNQYDIVIYRRNYPKLDFGGGISGFLIESVIATVEVKSTLAEVDLEQAIGAASNAKRLVPSLTESFQAGYVPPKVLNYVVAYDGPAQMSTVYGWIPKIHARLGIAVADLPIQAEQRQQSSSPSMDGVFVLNRGFVYFDNMPLEFGDPQTRVSVPGMKWIYADATTGSLLLLFLHLQSAMANVEGRWLNADPYLSTFNIPNLQVGA